MSDAKPTITTRVAHAGHQDHRFFSWDVFGELTGHTSMSGLMAMAVSGRRLEPDEAAALDDIATLWTVADPRIWPLKVGRLSAAFGGSLEGLAASVLCLDCRYVGGLHTTPAAARMLLGLAEELGPRLGDAAQVEAAVDRLLRQHKHLPGFGVPFRNQDERLPPLARSLRRRGRHTLPFWCLQQELARVVVARKGLQPNLALGFVAACLDLGFDPEQIGALSIVIGLHTQVANAHEEAALASPALQALPPQWVHYVGVGPRRSPRAGER
jgi:hypothetical protein